MLSTVEGRAGVITLNRPKALNALTQGMIDEMTRVLGAWAEDDSVELVILRGAGERGLCAGGDIAYLYNDVGDGRNAARFWKAEYELNSLIKHYPKPYVAIMNGIVLGGGIGVSAHGSHRIVTDDSRIGMPEVSIGYSPDVGGSYLLAHAPDNLGKHLGFTGLHVGAAEALEAGLADTYVPADALEGLVAELAQTGDVSLIDKAAVTPQGGFGDARAEMVEVYSLDTAEEVLAALEELQATHGEDHWSKAPLKAMKRNSPLGIKVTEHTLKRAADMTLEEALTQEFWMSMNMQAHPEFKEGIRAQIIDKDRNPKWTYGSLEEVPADVVSGILTPLDDGRFEPPAFTPQADT
nr:enoyl-CoA hydratase/isomerase family protein [Corynebacterium aquatimens]